jgi:hypothetical protein
MRKFTIIAALTAIAILSICDSASACCRRRFRCRQCCQYYVPVTQCYYPIYYTQPVLASDQSNTGATDTGTTDTGATDTGDKKGDPITAEEQKWFDEMYPVADTKAEDLGHLKAGWADSTHAKRKTEYEDHKKMIKEAEEQAAKEQAEKDKKSDKP